MAPQLVVRCILFAFVILEIGLEVHVLQTELIKKTHTCVYKVPQFTLDVRIKQQQQQKTQLSLQECPTQLVFSKVRAWPITLRTKVHVHNMMSHHSILLDMGIISCIFNPVVQCSDRENRLDVEQRGESKHWTVIKPHRLGGLRDCESAFTCLPWSTAVYVMFKLVLQTEILVVSVNQTLTQADKHNCTGILKLSFKSNLY